MLTSHPAQTANNLHKHQDRPHTPRLYTLIHNPLHAQHFYHRFASYASSHIHEPLGVIQSESNHLTVINGTVKSVKYLLGVIVFRESKPQRNKVAAIQTPHNFGSSHLFNAVNSLHKK